MAKKNVNPYGVKVGQLWRSTRSDATPESATVRVDHIDGAHAVVSAQFSRNGKSFRQQRRVRLSAFFPHSKGFERVEEAAAPVVAQPSQPQAELAPSDANVMALLPPPNQLPS